MVLAAGVSPGYVEQDPWAHPPRAKGKTLSRNPHTVRQFTADGSLRYCSVCQLFKPDHSYHCKICRKCIYRLDHHCAWINNCVGRENTKYFIVFLLFIPLSAAHIGMTISYTLLFQVPDQLLPHMGLFMAGVMAFPITFFFTSFFSRFMRLICKGQTAMERHVNTHYRGLKHVVVSREAKRQYWDEIFGRGRWRWRLTRPLNPTGSCIEDGVQSRGGGSGAAECEHTGKKQREESLFCAEKIEGTERQESQYVEVAYVDEELSSSS